MTTQSLPKQLKAVGFIDTNVGRFDYKEVIGEGGNSNVFLYSHLNHEFAIKFLKKDSDDSKITRFKDEFFCVAQMPTHKNVVKYYHLDKVKVAEVDYYVIIMKRYARSVKKDYANQESVEKYNDSMRKIFTALYNGIRHIHHHEIIHRDLKPENVFVDEINDTYVIGDFGISKFDDDVYARFSKTQDGERLANFKFSAPEQSSNTYEVTKSSDIYSFGQLLQYFGTGDVTKGPGRASLLFRDESEFLTILDKVINKCIMHNPNDRFSSMEDIKIFFETESESFKNQEKLREQSKKDSDRWLFLHDLDDAIVQSIPNINRVAKISTEEDISLFLLNVDALIMDEERKDYLWMIDSTGGDLNYHGSILKSGRLYNVMYGDYVHQITIDEIYAYNDRNYPYKNFFIVLTHGMPQFEYSDINDLSKYKTRGNISSKVDYAIEWRGHYLDPDDVRNQYVRIEGETYSVNRDEFKDTYRFIKRDAFLVVPTGTPSSHMNDRSVATDLIEASVINPSGLTITEVDSYLNRIRGYYESWIRNAL
ncbi:TPA: protein kinase domain-containing protein [Klebsiella pneumoniae]